MSPTGFMQLILLFWASTTPLASRQRQTRTRERLSATTISIWPDASVRLEMDRGLTLRPRFSFLRSAAFNQPSRQQSWAKGATDRFVGQPHRGSILRNAWLGHVTIRSEERRVGKE